MENILEKEKCVLLPLDYNPYYTKIQGVSITPRAVSKKESTLTHRSVNRRVCGYL